MSKVCTRCFAELPLDDFSVHPSGRLGRQARCRACMTADARVRRKNNPEPFRRSGRKAYKVRQAADPTTQARASAAWRASNPERHQQLSRAYVAARAARIRAAFVERVDRRVVWRRDGGVCHICRRAADITDWHLDHVHPLAHGGKHSYANTAVSHPDCNRAKGDTWPWPVTHTT